MIFSIPPRASSQPTDGTHAPCGFPISPAGHSSQVTAGFAIQLTMANQLATLPQFSSRAAGASFSSPVELSLGSYSRGSLSEMEKTNG
jgi:hypothetical protein